MCKKLISRSSEEVNPLISPRTRSRPKEQYIAGITPSFLGLLYPLSQNAESSNKTKKDKKKKQYKDRRDSRDSTTPTSGVNAEVSRSERRKKKKKDVKKITCYNCNKLRHDADQCLDPWKSKN